MEFERRLMRLYAIGETPDREGWRKTHTRSWLHVRYLVCARHAWRESCVWYGRHANPDIEGSAVPYPLETMCNDIELCLVICLSVALHETIWGTSKSMEESPSHILFLVFYVFPFHHWLEKFWHVQASACTHCCTYVQGDSHPKHDGISMA